MKKTVWFGVIALFFLPPSAGAQSLPVQKCAGSCVKQIILPKNSGCILSKDGSVSCWSLRGHKYDPSQPRVQKVEGLPKVVHLATDRNLAICAATEGGEVYCWGNNMKGIIPGEKQDLVITPKKVAGFKDVVALAIQPPGNALCGVLRDGGVKCVGYANGSWGSDAMTRAAEPTDVPGLSAVAQMEFGDSYSCFRLTTGEVRCAGENYVDQLGVGESIKVSQKPLRVPEVKEATSLSIGRGNVNCASTAAGQVYCWGRNLHGEHGVGNKERHATPVQVPGIEGATSVSVGVRQACALVKGGEVVCWGTGQELGDGTNHMEPTTPVKVSGIKGATSVVSGHSLSCATIPGQVPWCWGSPYVHGTTKLGAYGLPAQIDWVP